MKRPLTLLLILLGALAFSSCEKTAIPEEDSMFIIRAVAGEAAEAGVPLDIILVEGTLTGTCRAEVSVISLADGSTPPYEVLLDGNAAVSASSAWTFGDDGAAHFVISGVPAGSYAGTVKVTRWYHTSTDRFSFTVK